MKILHIDIAFVQGGIHNMLVEIMDAQKNLGHQVSLIVLNDELNPIVCNRIPKDITTVYIGRPTGSLNPWYMIKLIYYIRKISPDVIHCHNASLGKIIWLFGIPSVLTVHDIGMATSKCRYFNHVIAISQSVGQDIKHRIKAVDVEIVYNGVDFKSIRYKSHANENGCKRFVVVSRLVHKKKGFDLLLEALGNMYQKGIVDWTLDFIGDGASMRFLIDKTKEFGLEKNISFKGEQSKEWINNNLCTYDAFLMTSRYEGFGLTVIEAIGAGLEVLSSNIDGPAEILEKGEIGHLFESDNLNSLVDALVKLHTIDCKLKKCTEENRNYIIKKYSIENTASNYLNVYKK